MINLLLYLTIDEESGEVTLFQYEGESTISWVPIPRDPSSEKCLQIDEEGRRVLNLTLLVPKNE